MLVLKFGGSSVAGAEPIKAVGKIVSAAQKTNSDQIVVVVSAFQRVTDTLIHVSRLAEKRDVAWPQLFRELADRHLEAVRLLLPVDKQSRTLAAIKMICNELEDLLRGIELVREVSVKVSDLVLGFGERLSALIVADYLTSIAVPSEAVDAREILVGIGEFGNGRVDYEASRIKTDKRLRNANSTPVVTGFIGSTIGGDTITFGRGGSDYTAAALGALLEAREVQIWTDVNGFLTADPRKVESAFTIPQLTYDEAMELSHSGAKVIYPPTLQPALSLGIPVRVLNTFNPDSKGSLISASEVEQRGAITGISSITQTCLIRLQGSGMIGVTGTAERCFAALARVKVNVIFISQAASEHSICVAVSPQNALAAKDILNGEFAAEISRKQIDPCEIEDNLAIISIVGENMRHRSGIAGTLFSALGRSGVNVVAIAQGSSELSISVVIEGKDETRALNVLHDAFFLSDVRAIKLFLAGTGLVGKTLLKQLASQRDSLKKSLGIDIRLCGVTNSRKMVFNSRGLQLAQVQSSLESSVESMDLSLFLTRATEETISTTVFIDCTANDGVAESYVKFLEKSIPVVTANKRAQSGDLVLFRKMQATSREKRAPFLFEASVGAGLPVISTLTDLVRSGDQIKRIDAVLSGTLSYIFSQYSSKIAFSDLVKNARQLGYTEPDPRDDLNGKDVARKILILAREAGVDATMDDVQVENLIPEPLRKGASGDEFMAELPKFDAKFLQLVESAEKDNKKLRYIASLVMPQGATPAKLTVRLSSIEETHPFWSLSNGDNILAFTTARYLERPLVVKGPGAGAEVTAAGIFADIIRAAQ